jgi:Sugar-tranasporters, 12 TM
MANFNALFWAALALCAAVTFRSSDYYKRFLLKSGGGGGAGDDAVSEDVRKVHTSLLKRYLFVYLTATLSDWLQGPYVYALYSDYGFQQHEIAQLFVAGFGSSMIFGSFVGGMADWGGRRFFVIIFAVVYAASCITKRKLGGRGVFLVGWHTMFGLVLDFIVLSFVIAHQYCDQCSFSTQTSRIMEF